MTKEKIMAIFSMILSLLCGVSLFLFGMSLMGDGLKLAAGNKLEAFLYKMTNTPLKGVALGTGVTSVIQSSSATTVMVIGFVNSGMMKLKQAIGIIMGANIGTSITGWILCLSYIGGSGGGIASIFSTATISAVVAVIGIIFRMFCKRSVHKNIGNIMLGFAILMTGMQMMSGAVSPLRENPTFIKMLTMFSNPLAGILVGILFTAVLQSASASVGILQSLSLTGLVSWNSAVYIIMGQNIGTCVTALLSSVGTSKNAKGAAYIHLLFNVIGSVFFSILAAIFFSFYHDFGFQKIGMVEISLIHTGFNIANTVIMFPFSGLFVKMAEKLATVTSKNVGEDETVPVHLDDRILSTPSIAMSNCTKEIVRLGNMSLKNLTAACESLENRDGSRVEKILEREKNIDKAIEQLNRRKKSRKKDWKKIKELVSINLPEEPYDDDHIILIACTDAYDFTPIKKNEVFITDDSTYLKYFVSPTLELIEFDSKNLKKERIKNLWAKGYPDPKEFMKYLINPVTTFQFMKNIKKDKIVVPRFDKDDLLIYCEEYMLTSDPINKLVEKNKNDMQIDKHKIIRNLN